MKLPSGLEFTYVYFPQYQPRGDQIIDKKNVPILPSKVVSDDEVLEKDSPKVKKEISTNVDLEKDKPEAAKEGRDIISQRIHIIQHSRLKDFDMKIVIVIKLSIDQEKAQTNIFFYIF